MTETEVIDWIAEQWDVLGDTFTMIPENQRGGLIRYRSEFLSA
jgi:alkanesulfonate monooxygenase SsuD/methylene tetrahydromethanopterin reductase-like flavin-dependent oxidoreductase (luciferase family)